MPGVEQAQQRRVNTHRPVVALEGLGRGATAFQGRVQRGALPVEAAATRPHPWRRLVQAVAQAADLDHGPAEDAEQLLVGDMRVAQVDEALVVTEYCVEH